MSSPILFHTRVVSEDVQPSRRTIYFLHGVFGMGSNFRTVAKEIVALRPDWEVVLVDLRGHGMSQGFDPPHDLAHAADDVIALAAAIDAPIDGLLGHSFGGKVALTILSKLSRPAEIAISVDSSPSARPGALIVEDAGNVLGFLESLPMLTSREHFVSLAAARGFSKPTTDWLAMNVRRTEGGDALALRLDLPAIRAMLVDYYEEDRWDVAGDARLSRKLEFILGGRSDHYSAEDKAKLAALAAASPHVEVNVIATASHWVHADAPKAFVSSVVRALPEAPRARALE